MIITFLEDDGLEPLFSANESDWDVLTQLIEECTVETGIADLAHQHDHYLYGKPKSDHHFEQAGFIKLLPSG